jgi:hypothetical protein
MQTSSGHVVLAVSPNRNDLRRPACRVLIRPDGSLIPDDEPLEWNPMSSDERVVRVLPPEEHAMNTSELLAA